MSLNRLLNWPQLLGEVHLSFLVQCTPKPHKSILALICATLCFSSVLATETKGNVKLDLTELIGKEIVRNNYPGGWRVIGHDYFDEKNILDGQTIYKKNTRAFVLRKILALGGSKNPRRTLVIGAVPIGVNPYKSGELFISECKHPDLKETTTQRIFAEVYFKKCERYSSRVSAAWLIDSAAQKIKAVSPKGMRCVDTFFNNGPDGPTCPPIPQEW